jgi:RHS repeat-associated protein
VNGNWTYGHDAFNRLISSNQNSGTTTYSYAYDRFGNRWNQTVTHGTGTPSSLGFDANNHITASFGVSYDAAGDTTYDGTTTYTYDAEHRVITASNGISGSSSYAYDAEGRRIQKTTSAGGTVNFLYDLVGHEITQTSAGLWQRGEIYAGDRHVATYSSGATYFIHADWLGTERGRSNVSGAVCESSTSLPYGDALTTSGSCGDPSPMHFTGKEHDTETGLENFSARYDSSSMGRFMSPDPAGSFYASFGYPQSWNMYTYVLNNPLIFDDPTGKECVWDDGSFDAENDPDTGSAPACQNAGGTWVEMGQDGNWSAQGNAGLADLASAIQNGQISSVTFTGLSGDQYTTSYNSNGQVTSTSTPSGSVLFGYSNPASTSSSSTPALAGVAGVAVCAVAEPCGADALGFVVTFTAVSGIIDAYHYLAQKRDTRAANAAWKEIQKICADQGVILDDDHREQWHEALHQGDGDDSSFGELVERGVEMFCPGARTQ